jgi:hypothetical protein
VGGRVAAVADHVRVGAQVEQGRGHLWSLLCM